MLSKHKYSMETFCLQRLTQIAEVKEVLFIDDKLFFPLGTG